jgi:hypothetical protein
MWFNANGMDCLMLPLPNRSKHESVLEERRQSIPRLILPILMDQDAASERIPSSLKALGYMHIER